MLPGPLSLRWPHPQVLNEVVIDRGPSSYLSNVDVYLDGHLITTVQGDGRWASGLPGGCTRGGGGRLTVTLSLSRRRDRLHPNGQHGVRSRRRGLHDPPQRAGHHDHAHLPPLAILPAHRGSCGGRAEGRSPPPALVGWSQCGACGADLPPCWVLEGLCPSWSPSCGLRPQGSGWRGWC